MPRLLWNPKVHYRVQKGPLYGFIRTFQNRIANIRGKRVKTGYQTTKIVLVNVKIKLPLPSTDKAIHGPRFLAVFKSFQYTRQGTLDHSVRYVFNLHSGEHNPEVYHGFRQYLQANAWIVPWKSPQPILQSRKYPLLN